MNEARSFRENAALARRYDTPNDPVQTIASDAFPVIGVSDTWLDAELHFLRGSRLCGAALLDGPVAGSNSHVMLINPAGSSVIAVVEQLSAVTTSAVSVGLLFGSTGSPDTSQRGLVLDSRNRDASGNAGRSTCSIGNRTIVGATVGEFFYFTNSASHIPMRVVLDPGNVLVIAQETVNVGVLGSFLWRERRIELAEQRGA